MNEVGMKRLFDFEKHRYQETGVSSLKLGLCAIRDSKNKIIALPIDTNINDEYKLDEYVPIRTIHR